METFRKQRIRLFLNSTHRSNRSISNACVSFRERLSIDRRTGQLNIFIIGISPPCLPLTLAQSVSEMDTGARSVALRCRAQERRTRSVRLSGIRRPHGPPSCVAKLERVAHKEVRFAKVRRVTKSVSHACQIASGRLDDGPLHVRFAEFIYWIGSQQIADYVLPSRQRERKSFPSLPSNRHFSLRCPRDRHHQNLSSSIKGNLRPISRAA